MSYKSKFTEKNAIEALQSAVDDRSITQVKFDDGATVKVDMQTANALITVYKALNDDMKKKFERMVNKNKQEFSKLVDFAWKMLK